MFAGVKQTMMKGMTSMNGSTEQPEVSKNSVKTEPMTVPTAAGPVPLDSLGVTLMHEHVFLTDYEISYQFDTLPPKDDLVSLAVSKLALAYEAGVRTIVDMTVLGSGRRPDLVAAVANETPVNIIATTGLFVHGKLPLYFAMRGPNSPFGGEDDMADHFIHELTQGIAGTEMKAGLIKCVTDAEGMTPPIERAVRAAAWAHRQTGAPIITHTHDAPNGLEQQRILSDEGVDLTRVVIGHVDKACRNEKYLSQLVDAGSIIAFDQFGVEGFEAVGASLADRVESVARLCAAGYAEQIVLSHDSWVYSQYVNQAGKEAALPNHHFAYLTTEVVGHLREAGVSDSALQSMFVDNPRRILSSRGYGGY